MTLFKDLVKSVTIAKKGNKFSIREFMEEVRGIMGVPEWFVHTDSRKTRPDNGDNCVAMQIHFAGPYANKLEQDFNQLIITGKLSKPSLQIPGFVPDHNRKSKLGYRECDSSKKKRKQKSRTSKSSSLNSSKSIMSAGPHFISITILSFVIYNHYF